MIQNNYTVSRKSEYTPHISTKNLVYLLKGQYYTNGIILNVDIF